MGTSAKEQQQKRTDYMRNYRHRFSDNAKACGSHGRKIILDRVLVEQYYLNEQFSVGETALKLGVGRMTMMRNLQAWGIPIRPAGEQNHLDLSLGRRVISRKGKNNQNWKDGRTTKDGYVLITAPDHPRASRGRVAEHIVVWESVHNRPLPDGWHIHHKNGIRNDNRPCNLLALNPSEHAKTTHRMIDSLKGRIRELETENRLLQKALNDSQMIFRISEN